MTETPEKKTLTPLEIEQKKQSNRLRQVTLLWLTKVYPLAFDTKAPKPLKRQIEKDILAQVEGRKDVPSNRLIRRAVAYYTNSKAYHEGVLCHTHRYDLEGKPSEPILDAHKAFSQERLTQIEAHLQRRREKK